MDDPTPSSPLELRKWFARQLLDLGDGVLFNAIDVRTDLLLLQDAFPDPQAYRQVIARVIAELVQIAAGAISGQELGHALSGWRKHKFRSLVTDRRDMRIAFRRQGSRIEILGFGHRDQPWDFYDFVEARVQPHQGSDREKP